MLKRSYKILKSLVLTFTFSGLLKGAGIQIIIFLNNFYVTVK